MWVLVMPGGLVLAWSESENEGFTFIDKEIPPQKEGYDLYYINDEYVFKPK